jgi:hypothetical protein
MIDTTKTAVHSAICAGCGKALTCCCGQHYVIHDCLSCGAPSSCSTNPTVSTRTVTSLVGKYFNTGSGQPADDVGDMVALVVDTNNPKTLSVSNWMSGSGLGVSTDMGSYPIGTTLTVTLAWDKANHQFISTLKVKEDPSQVVRVAVPYYVSDTTPAT